MNWRGTRGQARVGLQIGSGSLRVATARPMKSTWGIDQTFMVARSDPSAEIGTADFVRMSEVFDRRSIAARSLRIASPSSMLSTATITAPDDAEPEAVEARIREQLGANFADADGSEVAWWSVPSDRKEQCRYFATALAHDQGELLLSLVEQNDVSVTAIEPESAALIRFLSKFAPKSSSIVTALLVDYDYALFVAALDGTVVYERLHTQIGLALLYDRLASDLGLSHDAAESVLRNNGMISSGDQQQSVPIAIASVVNSYLSSVAEQLLDSLSYVGRQFREHQIDRVYLLGRGAGIHNASSAIGDRIGVEVVSGNTLGPPQCNGAESWGELAVAIGLALRAEDEDS